MEGHAASNIYFGLNPMWISTALLVITYAVIITEKINRSIVALVGVHAPGVLLVPDPGSGPVRVVVTACPSPPGSW